MSLQCTLSLTLFRIDKTHCVVASMNCPIIHVPYFMFIKLSSVAKIAWTVFGYKGSCRNATFLLGSLQTTVQTINLKSAWLSSTRTFTRIANKGQCPHEGWPLLLICRQWSWYLWVCVRSAGRYCNGNAGAVAGNSAEFTDAGADSAGAGNAGAGNAGAGAWSWCWYRWWLCWWELGLHCLHFKWHIQ